MPGLDPLLGHKITGLSGERFIAELEVDERSYA